MRMEKGEAAPRFVARDVLGRSYDLADFRGKRVLLSFFREATCPFCNLRLYELTKRHAMLAEQGLVVLCFFQSPTTQIRQHLLRVDRPFPLFGDPDRVVYGLYGIEYSLARATWGLLWRLPRLLRAAWHGHFVSLEGDVTVMPADILIGSDGRIRGTYYGRDLADHLPFPVIERFARGGSRVPLGVPAPGRGRAP